MQKRRGEELVGVALDGLDDEVHARELLVVRPQGRRKGNSLLVTHEEEGTTEVVKDALAEETAAAEVLDEVAGVVGEDAVYGINENKGDLILRKLKSLI